MTAALNPEYCTKTWRRCECYFAAQADIFVLSLNSVVVTLLCLQMHGEGTLNPATHAYTFWEGIPARARTAFGKLFEESSTLKCIAIVQRAIRRQTPAEYMESLGFGSLQLMDTLSGIHMSGAALHPQHSHSLHILSEFMA